MLVKIEATNILQKDFTIDFQSEEHGFRVGPVNLSPSVVVHCSDDDIKDSVYTVFYYIANIMPSGFPVDKETMEAVLANQIGIGEITCIYFNDAGHLAKYTATVSKTGCKEESVQSYTSSNLWVSEIRINDTNRKLLVEKLDWVGPMFIPTVVAVDMLTNIFVNISKNEYNNFIEKTSSSLFQALTGKELTRISVWQEENTITYDVENKTYLLEDASSTYHYHMICSLILTIVYVHTTTCILPIVGDMSYHLVSRFHKLFNNLENFNTTGSQLISITDDDVSEALFKNKDELSIAAKLIVV